MQDDTAEYIGRRFLIAAAARIALKRRKQGKTKEFKVWMAEWYERAACTTTLNRVGLLAPNGHCVPAGSGRIPLLMRAWARIGHADCLEVGK